MVLYFECSQLHLRCAFGASLTAALMVRTIADMLRALAERESALIEGARIRHAATIGSMYDPVY